MNKKSLSQSVVMPVLLGLLASALGSPWCGGAATASTGDAEPMITGIRLEKNEAIISAHVPAGLKKVTLQSSSRLGTGAWAPRAVLRLDGNGGEITFRVPRSPDLEIVRVRADDTEPLPSSFYRGTNAFPGIEVATSTGNPDQLVFAAAPGGAATPTDNRAAVDPTNPAQPARDVVESDIWKLDGAVLYFFNQYRGLQVIDVANPDSPVVRGTLSLPAAGEQMYVLPDKQVVLLARNGCGWAADSSSQVLVVAMTSGAPTVSAALPLNGDIQESRLVGTALYVMTQSYRPLDNSKEGAWEWGTSLYAFDLSNPTAPVARPTLWYSGYGNVLTATDQYLFVSVSDNSNGSRIQCISIAAPDGTMQEAGSINVAGTVPDKFKMDLNGDIFTVISEQWSWQFPNNGGRWRPVTSLATFSLADPNAPRKLGDLTLADGEQLHATRFDGDRVYVVTFFQKDPLWVVDLSDPTKPAIQGELQVPGWSTYIQPFGDRLIALGIDNTNGWRVAVSLFDVHDPTAPALLSRVPLGENSSWSEANSDEKAFGFLPDAGLLLVPYSTYSTNNQQGVQLIDFSRDALAKRGFISHDLPPRRSTLYHDRILSISGRALLSVDASDRDQPTVRSELELAWPVNRVFVQGGYLLEIEASSGAPDGTLPTLRVATPSAPDQIVNRLSLTNLPVAGATVRDGRLYLLQGSTTYSSPILFDSGSGASTQETNSTVLVCSVIDLTQLPALAVISSTELATGDTFNGTADPVWPKPDLLVWLTQQANYWRGGYPGIDYIGGISIMPVRGGPGFWYPFFSSGESKLFAVDVANPLSPQFVSEVSLSNTNGWATFSKGYAADNSVFLSQQLTETTITGTNYFITTNLFSALVTNVVPVTNYTKVPEYSTETNLVTLTNVIVATIKNTPGNQPVLIPGTTPGLPTPAQVIAGGAFHSMALSADGRVWTWGNNGHRQLADDTAADRSEPKAIDGLASISSIAAGRYHNLALKSDGTVWAWGDDAFGQLGNGTAPRNPDFPPLPEEGSSSPVQVLGLNAVVAVGAGAWHSLALQADGTVWSWGANEAGQLGDGTFDDQPQPVRVPQARDVIQIAGGDGYSVALRKDGTVLTWGGNDVGQLGDGTTVTRNVPTAIPGLAEITFLACGRSHDLALKKDGTVWAWGLNESGQLGDGTTDDHPQPSPIPDLKDVVAVAAGDNHSLALRNDGSVWAWGRALEGQLGVGENSAATKPVQVGQLPPSALVTAGANHSLAVSAAGDSIYAWGNNEHGQLGQGDVSTVTNVFVQTNAVAVTTWTEETTVILRTNLVKVPVSTTVTNAQPVYTSRQISYLNVIDYAAPSAPLLRQPITIPGALTGLSHGGALLYLVGNQLGTDSVTDGSEWLHACAYDGVACYLVDSHPLPKDFPHAVLVHDPSVFVTRPEVDKTTARALEVWAMTEAGKFAKLSERTLASNASSLRSVGDLLAVQEDTGLEVFDLRNTTDLPLIGTGAPSGCLGWNLDSASGSRQDGLWLPLDFYGIYQIQIKR